MKITIDLQDPQIQESLRLAIEERVQQLTAERIDAMVRPIIEKKLERLDFATIGRLCADTIRLMVNQQCAAGAYGKPSSFDGFVKEVTEKLIREALARK